MIEVLFAVGAICFLFGVVYPLMVTLIFPIYKALGGKKKFKEYMEEW